MDDEVAILQNVQNVDVIELSSGDDEVVAASQAPARRRTGVKKRRRIGPDAAAQAPARHIAAKRGKSLYLACILLVHVVSCMLMLNFACL